LQKLYQSDNSGSFRQPEAPKTTIHRLEARNRPFSGPNRSLHDSKKDAPANGASLK